MNKLKVLRDYSFRRLRDTWASLGSQTCNSSTRFYNKDAMYALNDASSALNGYMFFVTTELAGVALWENATLEDYDYGEISFGNNIISGNFIMLMTADELASVTEPVDETWDPFPLDTTSTLIDIPPEEYEIILSKALGSPIITAEELEYNYDQICSNMIKPALQEYFKWFPKVEIAQYPLSTANLTELEFPTGAYDVMHVQVNQGVGSGGPSNILLRYFDEIAWSGGSGQGNLGIGGRNQPRTRTYDYGSMMLDRATRQGMINYATRVHHNVVTNHGKKILQVSSNKMGYLQVHWAFESNDWLDVDRSRLPELRRLCIAHIRENFGVIRSQAKSDIPGAVDYSSWEKTAIDEQKEITKTWAEMTKFSGILRGSL